VDKRIQESVKFTNTRCPPTYEESVQKNIKNNSDENSTATEAQQLMPVKKMMELNSTSVK